MNIPLNGDQSSSPAKKIPHWLWCLQCERCFSVLLSEKVNEDELISSPGESYSTDLEKQLGVADKNGEVYATCPYTGCVATLLNFLTWERFRKDHPDVPEVPEEDKVYPLYPLDNGDISNSGIIKVI